MAAELAITVEQGASWTRVCALQNAGATAYDLTGCTIEAQARGEFNLGATPEAQFVVTYAASRATGLFRLSLSWETTADQSFRKIMYWDIMLTDADGTKIRLIEGGVEVTAATTIPDDETAEPTPATPSGSDTVDITIVLTSPISATLGTALATDTAAVHYSADSGKTSAEKLQARTNLGAEASLGNPATTGYVLSSTTAGVRSWVAQSGGGSGTVTVDGANVYLVGGSNAFASATNSFGDLNIDATASLISGPDQSGMQVISDEVYISGATAAWNLSTGILTGSGAFTLDMANGTVGGSTAAGAIWRWDNGGNHTRESGLVSSTVYTQWSGTQEGINVDIAGDTPGRVDSSKSFVYSQKEADWYGGSSTVVTTKTLTGTFTASGSPATTITATGNSAAFQYNGNFGNLKVGQFVRFNSQCRAIASITSATVATLSAEFGAAMSGGTIVAGYYQLTGTVSVSASGTTVTGSSTLFTTELAVGSVIWIGNETKTVSAIASATSLTISEAHTAGASGVNFYTGGLAVNEDHLTMNTIRPWLSYGFAQFPDMVGTAFYGPTAFTIPVTNTLLPLVGNIVLDASGEVSSGYLSSRVRNLSGSGSAGVGVQFINRTNNWTLGTDVWTQNGGGDFHFFDTTGNAVAMTMKATTRRIGIGTLSPATELDVNGTVTATAFSGSGAGLSLAAGTTQIAGGTDKTVLFQNGTAMDVDPSFTWDIPTETLAATRLSTTGINDTNSNELFKFTATGSAVNELTVANAAIGGKPTISATGSDTDIGIGITAKGDGDIVLTAGGDITLTSSVSVTSTFSATGGTSTFAGINATSIGATTPGSGSFTTGAFSGALTYGGVTLSNSVTGTGSMVLSASPTFTGTVSATNVSASGNLTSTGASVIASAGGNIAWSTRTLLQAPAAGRLLALASGGGALDRFAFHTETTSDPAFIFSGTDIKTGLGDGSNGGSFTASGTLAVTGATTLTGLLTTNGGISIAGGQNIALSTTTGTKIGTGTTQLLGFYNATPVDQPAAVADITGGAVPQTAAGATDCMDKINLILARLRELGLIAT